MATKALDRVRRYALGFPEAHEDHPWGESAFKVRGKTFVFAGGEEGMLRLSLKLPQSKEFALEYPFTAPTGYGLGRSGWITASFTTKEKLPFDVLEAWIAESYRAIAPKSLAVQLVRKDAPAVKKASRKRGNGARALTG
jgi:predicted DNA-binding protein (MmcQ/YjbR family)